MKTFSLVPVLLRAAVLLPAPLLAAPDFVWTGAAGPGFTDARNWGDSPAPTTGAINPCGKLYITNGDKTPLTYAEPEGVTVMECDDFKIGTPGLPGGSLLVGDGELVISSRWAPMVGHHNNRASHLTITGGRLIIRSAPGARESELNFRLGNGRGPNTRGVVDMLGGLLVIETRGNLASGGLVIASGDAHGEILLQGGMIVVTSVFGTSFQPVDGGTGVGVLTFGIGDGVFMQTDSRQLTFGSNNGGAASHINFVRGSGGQLSLAGATREDYEIWVRTGRIRLADEQATPDKFKYTRIDGQGIYQLAPSR